MNKTKEQVDAEQAMLAAAKIEDSLPTILDLAWAINNRDISRTLKRACKKVFSDAGVDMEKRLERASAIRREIEDRAAKSVPHPGEEIRDKKGTGHGTI